MLIMLAGAEASAEERCKFTFESGTRKRLFLNNSDWTLATFRIAVFEDHHGPSATAKPNCEGLKIVERWGRGFSDTIDRNGRAWGYTVTTLENGDKIYGEWSGTTQTEATADGSTKNVFEGTQVWVGGTGRYQGVRGIERDHSLVEMVMGSQGKLEAKSQQSKHEVEYWFEK
jgi:hypothetical protein